jgi:hypothetical protein
MNAAVQNEVIEVDAIFAENFAYAEKSSHISNPNYITITLFPNITGRRTVTMPLARYELSIEAGRLLSIAEFERLTAPVQALNDVNDQPDDRRHRSR